MKRSSADGSASRTLTAIGTRILLAVTLLALTPSAYAQVVEPNHASVYPDNQTYIQPQEKTAVEKVVRADEWKDANNPRRMLARIQSNLDRVAVGRPVLPAPASEALDPLLKIVAAYSDFMRGDFKSMDAHLAAVERSAKTVREGNDYYGNPIASTRPNAIVSFPSYTAATRSPFPLVRLYAGVRVVDGALFGSFGNPLDGTGPVNMHTASTSPLDGTWLKLPCRTVIARVQRFKAVAAMLKSLGGPVLDCPVDELADYAEDEVSALHPDHLNPHVTPPVTHRPMALESLPKPPPPGSREAAVDEMATHPQRAAPILERYSHVDALGELDYALFLHAFKPETSARDAVIRDLLSDIVKKARVSQRRVSGFAPKPYDGTDASLLNIIRLASITGVANSDSAFYAIPCAILIARPALVAATGEYFGSNMDNFMPRSGCAWGRGGTISGFPDKAVGAFESASAQADGNFIATFQGSMVYGLESAQNAINTKMRLDPRSFLDLQPEKSGDPSQAFQYPYQVWGYISLNNYVVSLRIKELYVVAHDQLAAYYREQMGLDREDSNRAAKNALFAVTFGSNCGNDVPQASLRRMLLQHGSLKSIDWQLRDGVRAPEIDTCAKYAGLDPLLLVAVGDPAIFPHVLPLILQYESNINIRNPIGKTALMEAAQFNQLGIVDSLLAHHASVNATTWGDSDPLNGDNTQLGNDARTALMYAAANGSLKLIKALLNAGADPFQADTKGYRAIDYLLGYGPTPPNSHLSKQECMQAAQWLF